MLKPRLIFGLLLIMLGVAALVYQEFSYTTEETILQIGALKATAEVERPWRFRMRSRFWPSWQAC